MILQGKYMTQTFILNSGNAVLSRKTLEERHLNEEELKIYS
jgi:hypothetical protein